MKRSRRVFWLAGLFAVSYVPVLWVSAYNRMEPALFGIPFFYWFQFVWIIVTAVLTAAAYFARV